MRILLKILLIPCCSCFDGSGGLLPLRLPVLRYDTQYRGGAAVPDWAAGVVRRSGRWLYRVYDIGMAGQSYGLPMAASWLTERVADFNRMLKSI